MIAKLKKKYTLRLFRNMDSKMVDQALAIYFKKCRKMPFHLYLANAIVTGEKRLIDITEEINQIPGVSKRPDFVSSILKKLKCTLGTDIFPDHPRGARPQKHDIVIANAKSTRLKAAKRKFKRNTGRNLYVNECAFCGEVYWLDELIYTTNLCVCLKCAPRGAHFRPLSSNRNDDMETSW